MYAGGRMACAVEAVSGGGGAVPGVEKDGDEVDSSFWAGLGLL